MKFRKAIDNRPFLNKDDKKSVAETWDVGDVRYSFFY
jgi:hypothetical protein